MERLVMHVDMDAFFASVEQLDHEEYRGKPLIVGGLGGRGVVSTCSYEARRFGVHSAMPMGRAQQLCPQGIFIEGNYPRYAAVSAQIFAIFARYSPVIEPLSIDEAFLDLTGMERLMESPQQYAQALKAEIREQTGIVASVGIAPNKFLAKLASDQRKPDGLFVIPPEAGPEFVQSLPVGRFHGVGPATAARMHEHGIRTGADLARQSLEFLTARFGKSGSYYWNIARGIDLREVRPDRIRKSIGAENTYSQDLRDLDRAMEALAVLAGKVWRHAENAGRQGRTVTLKVKYGDFRQITRARSLTDPVSGRDQMLAIAGDLLRPVFDDPHGVRLLGITLSALDQAGADEAAPRQLGLFDQGPTNQGPGDQA